MHVCRPKQPGSLVAHKPLHFTPAVYQLYQKTLRDSKENVLGLMDALSKYSQAFVLHNHCKGTQGQMVLWILNTSTYT